MPICAISWESQITMKLSDIFYFKKSFKYSFYISTNDTYTIHESKRFTSTIKWKILKHIDKKKI